MSKDNLYLLYMYFPLFIYLILSITSLVLYFNSSNTITNGFLISIIFTLLWSLILFFICKWDFDSLSWVFAFLPFTVSFFILQLFLQNPQ